MQSRIFRGNGDGRVFIFGCDLIFKSNSVVVRACNNTEGDTFDAFFGKVQRCLVGVIFNLCNLCTDQLIGIVDFFIDTIDESQLGKIPQAGGQADSGIVYN